jgi:hypothetical protein
MNPNLTRSTIENNVTGLPVRAYFLPSGSTSCKGGSDNVVSPCLMSTVSSDLDLRTASKPIDYREKIETKKVSQGQEY